MSNEEVNVSKCNCVCQNKYFKLGVTIAVSSFIGVYCAINLFCALHRPPVPKMMPYMMSAPFERQFEHHKIHKGDMKKFDKMHNDFTKNFKEMEKEEIK